MVGEEEGKRLIPVLCFISPVAVFLAPCGQRERWLVLGFSAIAAMIAQGARCAWAKRTV